MTDRIAHYEENLLKLDLHRENLMVCDTFERFMRCQVAFVTALVAEQKEMLLKAKADRIAEDAAQVFLRDTEFVTKIKDAVGKITETQVKTEWQVAAATSTPPTPCRLLLPERGHCATCDEIYAERDAEPPPPEPAAHIDDAAPYDPVRQERAERRFPTAQGQSSGQANNCEQEEGA